MPLKKNLENLSSLMSELPEDLVEEILCRVPATSLKRLQYTCKRWNRLFNDRRFTRKHLQEAPKESMTLMSNKFGFYSVSINLHRSSPVEVTDEFNLIDPHASLDQFKVSEFCHSSDGLLLCVCVNNMEENVWLVVWNPCTGQTKWIQPKNPRKPYYNYALGSYQDNKSGNNSYKILTYPKCEVYEINSNSWRILDVFMDYSFVSFQSVSLKGKTYWIVLKEEHLGIFLISFDYTTETFERLCLPYQYPRYRTLSLSLVREDKLSLLLQREFTSKTEIWVTNKIGETKVVSWIKVLAVDLKPELGIGNGVLKFLVDEEKKVLVCTQYSSKGRNNVYIVGEDNEVGEVDFGDEVRPFFFNYVPSLTKIQLGNDN